MKKINLIFASVLFIASCGTSPKESPAQEKTDTTVTIQKEPAVSVTDGEEITKYDNGVIKTRGEYKNGKREGVWLSFYQNGTQWSENVYENGLKNGKTFTYYENGKMRYEGFFKNDKKSGRWKFYAEDGKPVKEEDYGDK